MNLIDYSTYSDLIPLDCYFCLMSSKRNHVLAILVHLLFLGLDGFACFMGNVRLVDRICGNYVQSYFDGLFYSFPGRILSPNILLSTYLYCLLVQSLAFQIDLNCHSLMFLHFQNIIVQSHNLKSMDKHLFTLYYIKKDGIASVFFKCPSHI